MPVFRLDERMLFPDPELADDSGVLAVGGDLSAKRLLLSYSMGIFPWYSEGSPILWHSPDPRMVLRPSELHVPRSLSKRIRKEPYDVRWDSAFSDVIVACARVPRFGQAGTWITDEMIGAYIVLHELGYAHSVEAFDGEQLVGGVYGVSLGGAFFGESMFARADDASKICFAELVRQLRSWEFSMVDCQVYTEHLERFGAKEWGRTEFLGELAAALEKPTRKGKWGGHGDDAPR